jgi:hypothetical protein
MFCVTIKCCQNRNVLKIQSALITTAFDIPAYSTNGKNLVVTNLHQTCRKPSVLRSCRSFLMKDRLKTHGYRSCCPTRPFCQKYRIFRDRDWDLEFFPETKMATLCSTRMVVMKIFYLLNPD